MSERPDIDDPAFLRSVLAASDDCIKVISLDGILTFMSEGGMRVMEVSDFNDIRGCPWPDFWSGEGNAEAKAAIVKARAGQSSRFVGAANTHRGTPKYWDVQVSPILGADGVPTSILSVSRDITRLKVSEEQALLLAQEVNHRMKNGLAMVQAIVSQSLSGRADMAVARDAILERVSALGRAQDLLIQSSWTRASLSSVIQAGLLPHGEQFRMSGPEVELTSAHTLALSLAVNELAVNSAKYGALSAAKGLVDIGWTDEAGDFVFTWTESGGPRVSVPERRGFGSALLTRAVPAYFGGEANLDFVPSGLVFRLAGRTGADPMQTPAA